MTKCSVADCKNKAAPTSANGYCSYHASVLKDEKKHSSPDPTSSQHPGNSPKKANVYDRLTDTSKYTGAHKERFDADGHGRGKAGREDSATGGGVTLDKLLDRSPADVRGRKTH